MNNIKKLRNNISALEEQLSNAQRELQQAEHDLFYQSKHISFADEDGYTSELTIESNIGSWHTVHEHLKDYPELAVAYIRINKEPNTLDEFEHVSIGLQSMKDLRDHLTEIIDFIDPENDKEEEE